MDELMWSNSRSPVHLKVLKENPRRRTRSFRCSSIGSSRFSVGDSGVTRMSVESQMVQIFGTRRRRMDCQIDMIASGQATRRMTMLKISANRSSG